jgi:hypothetical protein
MLVTRTRSRVLISSLVLVPQDELTKAGSNGQGSHVPPAEKRKCGGGPEILDSISDKNELELINKEIVNPLNERIRSA